MMSGKTIGRLKPSPDRTNVDETIRAQVEVEADIAAGRELLTARERSLYRDNLLKDRQLNVERARCAVLTGNGGKATNAPIGTAFERNADFTRRIIAMGSMTDDARLAEVRKLFDDVTAFEKRKAAWLGDVEREVEKRILGDERQPENDRTPWTIATTEGKHGP